MSFESKVIKLIGRVPKGRVATYGQIAALAGSPRSSRMVGWVLANSPEKVPWQRVINSRGRISIVNMAYPAQVQAELLKQEGIAVEERGGEFFVDLKRYLWRIDEA